MTTEAANLFPIYESPQQVFNFPDLDSTAGSEWDEDGGSSHQHLSAISKEQLFQMLQKARARYHKYKGRYSDVAKAYQDLERENGKIKTVMQQTQVFFNIIILRNVKSYGFFLVNFNGSRILFGLCLSWPGPF